MDKCLAENVSSSAHIPDAPQDRFLVGKHTSQDSQTLTLSEGDEAARAIRNALASAIDRGDNAVRQFQAELCDSGALRQLYNLAVARRPLAFEALRLLAYRNRIVVQQLANMGAIDLLEQILVRETRSGAADSTLQAASLQLLTSLLAFNLEIHSLVMRTKLVKRLVQLCRPVTSDAALSSQQSTQQHERQEHLQDGCCVQSNGQCPELAGKKQPPAGDGDGPGTQPGGGSVAASASSGGAHAAIKPGGLVPVLLPGTPVSGAEVGLLAADIVVTGAAAAAVRDCSDRNDAAGGGSGGALVYGHKAVSESQLHMQPQLYLSESSSQDNNIASTGAAEGDVASPAGAAHPDAPVILSQEQQSMAACAAVALRNLCHQSANHPGLLSAGAALELAAVMQREPDPYRRINATMAVALLVGHEEQHPLMRMDEAGIREMLMVLACSRAKGMCHGYFWTCWKVCQALARLSANEDNKQVLTREGGVEVLADVLLSDEHCRKAITVKYCVEALWNLAFYEPARQQILTNSALVEAIRTARQSSLDLVREVARGCLFTLGITDAGTRRSGGQVNHSHLQYYPHEQPSFDPRELDRVFSLADSTAATATSAVGAAIAGLGDTCATDLTENTPMPHRLTSQDHLHQYNEHQKNHQRQRSQQQQQDEQHRLRTIEGSVPPIYDHLVQHASSPAPLALAAVSIHGENGCSGDGHHHLDAASMPAATTRQLATALQNIQSYESMADWNPPVLACSPRPSQTSGQEVVPHPGNAVGIHRQQPVQQQQQQGPGDGLPAQMQRSNSGTSSRYGGTTGNGHQAQGPPDSPTGYIHSVSRSQGNGLLGLVYSSGHSYSHGHALHHISHQNQHQHEHQHLLHPYNSLQSHHHSRSVATDLISQGTGPIGPSPLALAGPGPGGGGSGSGSGEGSLHWQGVTPAGGKGGHIMISYEWGSQQKALMIKEALERRGLQTWMDVEKMSGSTLEAMALAVEGATAVLLCITKRYKESQACRAEAEYAFQQRKRIIPIMMERGYRPTGWLGILVGTKLYFDFSERRLINERVAALERELGPLTRLCRRPASATSAGPRSRPPSAQAGTSAITNPHPHLHGCSGHQHGTSSNHAHQRTQPGARMGLHSASRQTSTIGPRAELPSPSLSSYQRQTSCARRGSGASYVLPEVPYDISTVPDTLSGVGAVPGPTSATDLTADSLTDGCRYAMLPFRGSFTRRDSGTGYCGGGSTLSSVDEMADPSQGAAAVLAVVSGSGSGGGGSPTHRIVRMMLESPSPPPSQLDEPESEASVSVGHASGSSGGAIDLMAPLSLPPLPPLPPPAPRLQPGHGTAAGVEGVTNTDTVRVLQPPAALRASGSVTQSPPVGPAAAAAAVAIVVPPHSDMTSTTFMPPPPPRQQVHPHADCRYGQTTSGAPDHGHGHDHAHPHTHGVSHMHPDWRAHMPSPKPAFTTPATTVAMAVAVVRQQWPVVAGPQQTATASSTVTHVVCRKEDDAKDKGSLGNGGSLEVGAALGADPLLLHLPPTIGLQRLQEGVSRATGLGRNADERGVHQEGGDGDLSPAAESGTPLQFDPLQNLPFGSGHEKRHDDNHRQRHNHHHNGHHYHDHQGDEIQEAQLQQRANGLDQMEAQEQVQPCQQEVCEGGKEMASSMDETSCAATDELIDAASLPSVTAPDPRTVGRAAGICVRWSEDNPGRGPSPPARSSVSRYRLMRGNTSTSLGFTSECANSVFGGAAGAPSEEDSGLPVDEPSAPSSPPARSLPSESTPIAEHLGGESSLADAGDGVEKVCSTSNQGARPEPGMLVAAARGVLVAVENAIPARKREDGKEDGAQRQQVGSAESMHAELPSIRHNLQLRNDRDEPAGRALLHSISGGLLESVDGEIASTDGQSSTMQQPGGSTSDLLGLPGGSNAAQQFVQALHPSSSDATAAAAADLLEKELGDHNVGSDCGHHGLKQAVSLPQPQQQRTSHQAQVVNCEPCKAANAHGTAAAAAVSTTAAVPEAPTPPQQQKQPFTVSQSAGPLGLAAAAARSPFLTLLRPVTAALVSAAVALAPPSAGSRAGKLGVLERADTLTAVPIPSFRGKGSNPDDGLNSLSTQGLGAWVQGAFGSPLASELPPHDKTGVSGRSVGSASRAMAAGDDHADATQVDGWSSNEASARACASAGISTPCLPAANGVASRGGGGASAYGSAVSGLAALRLKAMTWASRRAVVDSAVATSHPLSSARASSAGGAEPSLAPGDALLPLTGVDGDADDLVGERLAMAMDSGSRINRSRQSMDLTASAIRSRQSMDLASAAIRSRQSMDVGSIARVTLGERHGPISRGHGHAPVPLPPPYPTVRGPLSGEESRPQHLGGRGVRAGGAGSEPALSARLVGEASESVMQVEGALCGAAPLRRGGSASVGGAPPAHAGWMISRHSAEPLLVERDDAVEGGRQVGLSTEPCPSAELQISGLWKHCNPSNHRELPAVPYGAVTMTGMGNVDRNNYTLQSEGVLDQPQRLQHGDSLVPDEDLAESSRTVCLTARTSRLDGTQSCGGGGQAQPDASRVPEEDASSEHFVSQASSAGLEMRMGLEMELGMSRPMELGMHMAVEQDLAVPPSSTSQLVERWKAPQVRDWLVRIGHGGLADSFEEMGITGRALCGLMRVMRGGGGAAVVRDMLRHELGVTGLAVQLELLEELHRLFD